MREEHKDRQELLLNFTRQEEEGDEAEGNVQAWIPPDKGKKMTCPNCKTNIDIENPERFFVKMECPKCGGTIEFEE